MRIVSQRFLAETHRTKFYLLQAWMKGVYDSPTMQLVSGGGAFRV